MTNTDDLLLRIKGCKNETLTTKKLLELGFNSYYIKKFVDEGSLVKTGRGIYEYKEVDVNLVNKYQLFNSFRAKVLEDDYKEAYECLIKNLSLQDDHEFDNHSRIYLLLLKELLDDSVDFSMIDSLCEFSEVNKSNFYNNFIKFRSCVMERNFYDAKRYLDTFAKLELERKGSNNISTVLFSHLLDAVIKKIDEESKINERKEKSKTYHREVVKLMKSLDFTNALETLETCIEYTDDDKNLRGFKRERELLHDIIYLTTTDGVIEYGLVDYTEARNDFNRLLLALKGKDYPNALIFANKILEYKESFSVINLRFLVDKAIYYNNVNLKKIEEANRRVNTAELANKSISAFKCFQFAFENEKYEEALNYLRISVEANPDKNHDYNNKNLLNMFEYLVKMIKEKCGFQKKDIEYDEKLTTAELFNLALENGDYAVALRNIGKLTYQNDSKVLDLFKTILHLMLDLDKKYNQKTNAKKEEIEKPKSKNSKTINDVSSEFITVPVMEEQIFLTDELVRNYVYDRKYNELFQLLLDKKKRNIELDRLEFFTLKLIRVLKEVESNKYEKEDHVYKFSASDPLKRLYEAIKCKDYPEVQSCIESIKTFMNDLFEINVYEMIVDDIYNELERQGAKKEQDEYLNTLTKRLTSLVDKTDNFTNDEIDELYQILNEILSLRDKNIYKIFINIIELIDLANNTMLDNTYFERFETDEKDYDARLNFFLSNGDYLSALDVIKKANFDKILKNVHFNDKLILKRLLYILERSLNKPFVKQEVTYEDDGLRENLDKLANLKRMLKKRDFYGAFNYYLNNKFKDNVLDPYIGDMILLYWYTFKEELDLYQEVVDAINNNQNVRLKYNNYLEYIQSSSLQEDERVKTRNEELIEKIKKLV